MASIFSPLTSLTGYISNSCSQVIDSGYTWIKDSSNQAIGCITKAAQFGYRHIGKAAVFTGSTGAAYYLLGRSTYLQNKAHIKIPLALTASSILYYNRDTIKSIPTKAKETANSFVAETTAKAKEIAKEIGSNLITGVLSAVENATNPDALPSSGSKSNSFLTDKHKELMASIQTNLAKLASNQCTSTLKMMKNVLSGEESPSILNEEQKILMSEIQAILLEKAKNSGKLATDFAMSEFRNHLITRIFSLPVERNTISLYRYGLNLFSKNAIVSFITKNTDSLEPFLNGLKAYLEANPSDKNAIHLASQVNSLNNTGGNHG